MEIKHLPQSHKHGAEYHHFGSPDHPSHARHSKGTLVDRALHPHKGNTTHVAIAGVTGQLGQLIVKHLLENEGVTVHGIARDPEKLSEYLKTDSRVKLFKSDMTDVASIREAVKLCSILISVIRSDPLTEVTLQKAMIDACVAEKVHRFIPNDFSLDWRRIDLDLIPQMKAKREICDYLDAQNSKVKGVHILTGAFMECQFSGGFLYPPDKSPAEGFSTWGTGDEIIELTSYDNVARWTAEVALNREAEGFFQFLGDRQSPKEIAKALEERYNLAPIPFTSKGSLEDLKHELHSGLENNRDSDDFWAWMGQSYSYFLSNGEAYLPTPLDNRRYLNWVEQETLENWLLDKNIEDLSKTGRV